MGRKKMAISVAGAVAGALLLPLGYCWQAARAEAPLAGPHRGIQAARTLAPAKTPFKVQRYVIPYKMHRKYLYHSRPSTVQAVAPLNPRIPSLPGSGHDYLKSYMNNH